jgi:tetratricopeptide (TPR) repeat protein
VRLTALFLCVQAVLPTFAPIETARAETIDVVELKAAPEKGYGRMVLTFQDRTLLPVYDAVITGGVLRISFEDPIDVNVDDVPLDLADYIAIARRDPDGSAIRFALKDQFRINTLEAGEKLFVDILPSNWQGLPPGLPDDVVRELAKRAEAAMRKVRALEQARLKAKEGPQVTLHIGEHPTFTRLVFDWSIRFDTAFVREDDIVKVTFNHPAQLDISKLRAHLPQGVVDATSFLDKGKLKFLMRIDPSVDIRAFREEQTYVIDVTPENMEPRDPANAHIASELNAGATPSGKQTIVAPGVRNTKPDMPAAAPVAAPVADEAGLAMVPFDAGTGTGMPDAPVENLGELAGGLAPVDGDPAESVPPPGNLPRAKPQEAGGAQTVQPADIPAFDPENPAVAETAGQTPPPEAASEVADAAPDTQKPAREIPTLPRASQVPTLPQVASAPIPVADAPPVEPAAVQPYEPTAAPAGSVPPAVMLEDRQATQNAWRASGNQIVNSPERPPENIGAEARNFVLAEARRIGNTVRVVFPFVEPVSSAVFRRHDSIWLVFDTDATIDTRGMVSALADTADTIVVEERDGYQVLRLDLNDPVLATVGADGNAWSLVVGDMILEPSVPLKMERNVRGDGGSVLRVLYKDPRNIRQIEDPFVGDKISIVTGLGPPRGLLKPQKFVDLEALSSAQGIAIAARSDGVSMKLLGDDVIIEKTGGLALSNRHLRGGTGVFNSIADPNEPGYVEFVSLTTAGPEKYRDRLLHLQEALSNSPQGRRRKALMDLSRFYLAHQFAQEALGLMNLALEEDPALAEESSFNLMMGAAETMAGRYEEAYTHLNRPDLKNSPDAAVWQTIVDVALGNWTPARIAMPRGRAVVGNYPKTIQVEFNLSAAQAMVEANDFGMANSILAEIEPSEVSSSQAARYDILRGRVADASGRSQEALSAFDFVAKSDDRPRAAEAEYRALRIRYRDGELGIDDAIDQLAGLATSWRGDEIELKTLRFLSQLHAEKGQYREAFEAMRSAVQANPDSDTTRLLQEEMNGLFISLFLDGKADDLSTVKALALYYDFREMTPIGRQGDEMVRLLTKRLVQVDLLDQAIELLRHQVDNRLKGAARAQIAADLSALYLMDRKPEKALRVLNVTRQASLPSTLERQRNIVEARALTASGRPDLALELVRNMRGTDVDRLRADTFWAAQSWREAGEQLEAMHGSRWSDTIPLDPSERRDILKAGIAYSLAGDQLSLNRLQAKYTAKMAESPEALAFDVVTRPIENQGVEFLEVANKLADTDTLETFMEEYRRQYMNPAPSGSDQSASNAPPTGAS